MRETIGEKLKRLISAPPWVLTYGVAVLGVGLATMLRTALDPLLGLNASFVIYYLVINISALFGGLGPGLVATALSLLAFRFFFILPTHTLMPVTMGQAVQLALFGLVASLTTVLCHMLRQAWWRARMLNRQWRSSEQRYRHLIEAAKEGIWLSDREGRTQYVNQRLAELLGYPAAELTGRPLRDCLAQPGDPEALRCFAPQPGVAEERRDFSFRRKDGSLFWASVAVNTMTDEAGKFAGTLGLLTDIDERKRTEQALRETEERFRLLLENVSDYAIVMLDPEGCVISWNEGGTRLTGYAEGEILGQSLNCIFTPTDQERNLFGQEIEQATRQGRVEHEHWHVRKDGSLFWANGVVTPLRNTAGEVTGLVKIMRDITERKRMEDELHERAEQLAEIDRRKDHFLATLAHELRNPLAPILNSLYIMEQRRQDAGTIEHARQMIERQVRHMVRLVDDLLDVSRITRGKIQLRLEPLELAAVIRRVTEAAQPQLKGRDHHLSVWLPPGDPVCLLADPTRIEQILTNLLNNAVKYTAPGGSIWISLESEDGQAVVRVRDNGLGIAPDMLPHVFDMFIQADSAQDRSQGGLGIGLTLVRSLVELHGGRVEAVSAGTGQGSEFIVRLPLLTAEGAPLAPAPHAGPVSVGEPRRVLIVEDNSDAAQTLAELLELWGHEVQVVHNGPAAILSARVRPPQVVLLDIGLPQMDGYEVARRLRREGGLESALLVALTGYGQDEDRRKAEAAGFDLHLTKPVEAEELGRVFALVRNRS